MAVERVRVAPKGHNIYSSDEYVAELQEWVNRVVKLNRMRKADSQIGAILRLFKLPIRQTKYDVIGGDETQREWIKKNLFNKLQWRDFIRLSLTMLDFGVCAFEKVFAYDKAEELYYYRKFQFLPQLTIHDIVGDKTGGLDYLEQDPPEDEEEYSLGDHIQIKAQYLLLFVNDREGDWFGTSLLRNGYGNWKIKDLLLKVDAIKQDRFGVGLPVAWMKAGYTDEDINLVKKSLKNIRSHESGFMIMPPNVEQMEVLNPGKETDVIASINYNDESMSKSVLGQFLDLGTTGAGNRALGEIFVEVFLLSLNALLGDVLETINRYAIQPLVDINWGPQEEYPELVAQEITLAAVQSVVEAIEKLTSNGFVKPNRKDNIHFRQDLGMPITEEEEEESEQEPEEEPAQQPTQQPPEQEPPEELHDHSLTEFKPGDKMFRELQGLEQFVNFEKYAEDLDVAKRKYTIEMVKIRDRQVKSLVYDMTNRGISPEKVRPKHTDRYASTLLRYSERAYLDGAHSVEQEKKTQLSHYGIEGYTMYEFDQIPAEAIESIRDSSAIGAQVISSRTKNRVADLYILYKDQGLSNKEISARIYAETLGTGQRVVSGEFSRVDYQWGRGRNEAARVDDEVQGGFYSAILDGQACEVCLGADGAYNAGHARPFLLEELPDAPNPSCKGGDKCRCIHVYQYFQETGGGTFKEE